MPKMSLQDNIRKLAGNPTLRELGTDALQLIAFSADTRILRAGDVLFRLGDKSDGGFMVLSGSIALEDSLSRVTLVGPLALIGDTALIAETLRPCTAVARQPSSVLKISRALFHRVIEEFPDSAARLRRTLDARLAMLRRDLESLHLELR